MAAVGSLVVRIGADTSGLRRGGDESMRTLDRVKRGAGDATKKMAAFAAAATAAGAALAAGLTRSGLAAVDAQAKLARQLDGTIGGLRGLQLAGNDAGVSTETMNSALQRMSARLGEAMTGTGTAKDALDRLGLSAGALAGMDVDERFAVMADRVRGLGLSGAETADILRDMGIRNTELVNLLRDGGGAIRAATEEAEDYGLAISEVDARQVEMANDAMARFALINEGVANALAVELAPLLLGVAKKINEAARAGGGFGDNISAAIDSAVTGFGWVTDAAHGFKVVLKGAELAAQGLGTVLLTVLSHGAEAWSRLAHEITSGLVSVIRVANRISPIDIDVRGLTHISQWTEAAAEAQEGLRAGMRESFAQTAAELHELMMQPLPSDGIKAWVAEARALGQELAEDLASKAQVIAGAGGQGGNDAAGSLDEAERERMQQRLQDIRDSLMSEEQLERASHQRKLEELALYRENELLSEAEHKTLREGLEQEHMDRLVEIRRRGMNAMQQFSAMSTAKQAKQVLGQLSQLTAGVASENKAMFEANKTFAISDAILSAYAGISKTLSAYPFPLSAAMAAAQAGVAFAQVRAISSQSFGAGGGAAPSLAGSTPAPPVTPVGGQGAGGGAEAGGRNIMISVQDDMLRAMITPIMNEIGEQLADGGRLGSLRVVS